MHHQRRELAQEFAENAVGGATLGAAAGAAVGYVNYGIVADALHHSYNLSQHTFAQECLNYLGPAAVMTKYAWWGAFAGAGMGLGFALASYLRGTENTAAQEQDEADESSDDVEKAVADALEKQVPQLVEDATSKAVAASLMRAESLFKRRQELLKMNKQYHESTNIHKTYGI